MVENGMQATKNRCTSDHTATRVGDRIDAYGEFGKPDPAAAEHEEADGIGEELRGRDR